MKKLIFLLAVLAATGCQAPSGESPKSSPTPAAVKANLKTLTAMGDSLTEGLGVDPKDSYPAQLERKLQADGMDWKVINAGLSGETSSGALTRLPWVLKTKPDAVLLVIGANDGLRGVDPALTKRNLEALVDQLKEQHVPVMLGGMLALPNLGADYASKFDGLYPEVAKEKGVPLIPFFLEGVARDPALNQEDGKHPTAKGYAKVVEQIYPQVKDWLKDVKVEREK